MCKVMMFNLDHRYSNAVNATNVVIFGPIPPPLGGVSVHCARVINKFKLQHNVVTYFNTTVEYRYRYLPFYLCALFFFLARNRPTLLYYHTSYLSNALPEMQFLTLFKKLFSYKFILIEHDCRYLYKADSVFKKKLNRVMRHVDQQVFIGNITFKSFQDNKITLPSEHSIEGAFLPPDLAQEPVILATYSAQLGTFIAQDRPLILANAFQLSLIEGKDLYGFDLCIDLVAALVAQGHKVGLVFVLAQLGDVSYFQMCKQRIKSLGIENSLFILTGQKEVWPLIKRADLFVRPTLSDGASVSVSEALYFGVPTLASDVCARPEGTVIFRVGDREDFIKKSLRILQKEVNEETYRIGNSLHTQSVG